MKLLIDDADLESIRKIYEYYPVDGVTTNPTILSKGKDNPFTELKSIRAFLKEGDLHVQTVALDSRGIIKDAERIISELGENTYIKIPAVKEGFKAMRELKRRGFFVTATAVYTPLQAYLSAKCNVDYTAVYVNRIDNLGYDGIETVKTIQNIFENNGFETKVLAASFKNSMQVLKLIEYGVGGVTAAPSIIEGFVKNAEIDKAVGKFKSDFESVTGPGKTMSSI